MNQMTNRERRDFLKLLAKAREDFFNWPHALGMEALQCMARFPKPGEGVNLLPRGEPTVLERWGKADPDSDLLLQRKEDGYWTHWHIAQRALDNARGVLGTVKDQP